MTPLPGLRQALAGMMLLIATSAAVTAAGFAAGWLARVLRLDGLRRPHPGRHCPAPETPAPVGEPAQAPRPGDPPCVERGAVRAGATTESPAPELPRPAQDAPATPKAGAPLPQPDPPASPGLGQHHRDTWVIAPPSGRHATAVPRTIPAQRTPTMPNPALTPLPLLRPWLVILAVHDGNGRRIGERYEMADPGRDAALAARTVTR